MLESRKQDVKAAVEQFYWIPDDVLREYAGETWADREIRFRTRLKENPWVLEEARGYTDPDEHLEFVTSRDMQNGKESSAEAKSWWRRVYEYARVESAAEEFAVCERACIHGQGPDCAGQTVERVHCNRPEDREDGLSFGII